MRQQYHIRKTPKGTLIWDVHRLVELALGLPVKEIPLEEIRELDEPFWFELGQAVTCREVAEHARLIRDTDLTFPIILSRDGRVMDGMHRVAKAWIEGRKLIRAVQFETDPEPDYRNVDLDDLPYDDDLEAG